ncbi:MAG: oligosaccharide flippase family protein, partial [Deltaproteobacteria bacterium]|nr:oligosaccharide flippase family protein [Deltaproteobacteria bacterium]
PKLRPYLWLLPVGVFGASTYSAFNFWAIRENNYKKIGWTKLIQGFMLTTSQIAIGSFKAGPLGLILGQILGHTSGTGNLALSAWRQNKTILKGVNLNKIVKAARRYHRFPFIASGSSFLDSLSLEAPLIFFAVFWGTSVVGWFGLCQRVIWAPLSVLSTSVSQVFFGEASRLLLKESNLLKNLYIRTAKKLFFIGLIPASALAIFSPWLFRILFGPEWSQSGSYAQILAPMVLVRFVVNPLSQTLNVLERQELQLLWVIIRLALVMTSLGMASALNFSDLIAVALFSGAMTSAYLLYFGLCWYVLCKK